MNPVRLYLVGCLLAALALAVPAIAQEAQPTETSGLINEPQKADVLIEYMHVPVEELPLPKGYVPSRRSSPSSPSGPAFPSYSGRPIILGTHIWLIRLTNRGRFPAMLAQVWNSGPGTWVGGPGSWGLRSKGKLVGHANYAFGHPIHYLTGQANEKSLLRCVSPTYKRWLLTLYSHGPTRAGPEPQMGSTNNEETLRIAALWPDAHVWGYLAFRSRTKRMPRSLSLYCELGKGVTWAFVENPKLAEQIIRDDPRTKTTAVTEQHKSHPRR